MKTINNYNFNKKNVLLLVDFNVPVKNNIILDNIRIVKVIPTINKILNDKPNKIIVITHLGRPNGKKIKKLSLEIVSIELSKLLKKNVFFYKKDIMKFNDNELKKIKNKIILLENIRFYKEEKNKDIKLAIKLKKISDIFVNDAFAASHRDVCSNMIIPTLFKYKCIGYLMDKEIKDMEKIFNKPKKPILAIIGGGKVSTKIGLIKYITKYIDYLILGGCISYTFLKYQGYNIGNSCVDDKYVNTIPEIIKHCKKNNVKLFLPDDFIVCKKKKIKKVNYFNIPNNYSGVDIGEKSIKKFSKIILKSRTIFFNGPFGLIEVKKFSYGTLKIIKYIGMSSKKYKSYSVIGGGESLLTLKKYKHKNRISVISTGGGAMLYILKGKKFPFIKKKVII
ncbi:MAG: phosphoglycerate kinase [Candidatus Shikimatogenerans bostrichidophilus]|nr:MAG: phosphoglycerate kinase [Candidatus Shikimatogenerans bostrichidophilus]